MADGLRDTEHQDLLQAEGLRLRRLGTIHRRKGVNIFINTSEVRKEMIENLKREHYSWWPLGLHDSGSAAAIIMITSLALQGI